MNYKHLNYEERVKIEGFLDSGKSKRAIARLLDRSINSISYEIRKNSVTGIYTAKKPNTKHMLSGTKARKGALR